METRDVQPPEQAGPKRVLYVDDNDDFRAMMTDVLEAEGYQVTAAGSAHQALRLLHSRAFDLVVTDHMMPDETGSWLLCEAAALGLLTQVPAMVVTANAQPEQVRRPPGTPVFQKPVDMGRFLAALRRLME